MVERSLARLSSGQRITRASDDAAGLAVSESLRTKARTLGRAALNVSDGLSAIQIIEGTLDAVGSLLSRMSELAAQAASGSLSSTQRSVLDREYQQLNAEIFRLKESSTFNGIQFLNGTGSTARPAEVVRASGGPRINTLSGDGRYITYTNGDNALAQLDLVTGEETVIDPDGASIVASSASGQTIAYIDGSANQLYVWDKSTGTSTLLIDVAAVGSQLGGVTISADGSTVAFTTEESLSSTGEPLGSSGDTLLTSVRISDGLVTQIATPNLQSYVLSADGTTIGFISTADLTGENGTNGFRLFLARTSDPTEVDQIGNSENFGNLLGFTNSNSLIVTSDIGLASVTWGSDTPSLLVSGIGSVLSSSMRADGLLVNFITTDDLLGTNPSGNPQLYQYDFVTGQLRQATNYEEYTLNGIGDTISGDGLTAVNTFSGSLLRYNFEAESFQFSISTGSGSIGAIQTSIRALNGALRGLGTQLITTESAARGALDVVRSNIEELAAFRGQLGAGGSRLTTAFNLITSATAETQAANSRITDVDVASEAALLTRNQIRQQVGAAILAQANLQPSLVLSLLSIDSRQ